MPTEPRFPLLAAVRCLGALALALLGACGGSSMHAPAPAPPLSLSAAGTVSLPVPVPFSASDEASGYYAQPYSGTTTVAITRDATVSGPVALAVSGLPANVVATFAQASTSAGTDELSIQAGRPDPADPTFRKQLYPATGTATVTVTATGTSTGGGALTATTTFRLVLAQEAPVLALNFTDAQGTTLLSPTVISLGSATQTEYFAAYQANNADFATQGPVTLALSGGVPAGLAANLDASSVQVNEIHSLTLSPQAGTLAPGFYAFTITARFGSASAVLPVVLKYSPYPFYIEPPQAAPFVQQGGAATFPLYLGHDDTFFGAPDASLDYPYVGDTALTAAGLPPGFTVTFGNAHPTGLASVPVTVAAAATVDPGDYLLPLQATRTGAGGVAGASPVVQAFDLPVTVSAAGLGSIPNFWIQSVEWGQTVLAPGLPLVAGKPAVLALTILTDQALANQPPVAFSVLLQDGSNLPLAGPSYPPASAAEGGLSGSGATVYSVTLPASKVTTTLAATLHTDSGLLPDTALPVTVLPATTLGLTLVPIVIGGAAPTLPDPSAVAQQLTAFWPLATADVKVRAPYTTATVIPYASTAGDAETLIEDGWGQLLAELGTLRITDGSSRNYYGMFDPGIPDTFTGSTVVGLSVLGLGAGIGLDQPTATRFDNPDAPLDASVMILVHEEGHAFNLNHAPAGGAGGSQVDFPYAGAADGAWDVDPFTGTLKDPGAYFDVMSYAPARHGVSDWNYLAALAWIEGGGGTGLADTSARTALSDHWVVSGWFDAAGAVHLAPLLRTSCAPAPALPGPCRLVLHTTRGDVAVPFGARAVPGLPQRHFAFTVPAAGDVTSLEILQEGASLLRRTPGAGASLLQARAAQDAASGAFAARESGGVLTLDWDPARHPYVSVFHEGETRTALGLHLRGGHAALPLDGLEAGGRFRIQFSDGIQEAVRVLERNAPGVP